MIIVSPTRVIKIEIIPPVFGELNNELYNNASDHFVKLTIVNKNVCKNYDWVSILHDSLGLDGLSQI